MIRIIILFVFFFGMHPPLQAQLEISASLEDKLALCGLFINTPLESEYKTIKAKENSYHKYDLAIWSKKEKLEIRYSIAPALEAIPKNKVPHLQCMKVISNVATNDEEARIALHKMTEKELLEIFNADWGAVAFFQPKPEFANYKHCKMLALFKEGKASAYVFFLFDDPSEVLDYRFHALQFE